MKNILHTIIIIIVLSVMILPTLNLKGDSADDYGALIIDKTSDIIFTFNERKECLDLIDIKTGMVINSILSGKEIVDIEIDEQRGILATIEEETIHILSTGTLEILSNISVDAGLTSIAIDPVLGLAVIPDEEDEVIVIDLNTYQILKKIKISEKPVSVAIDPQLHLAVIAHHTWGKGADGDKDKERDNITVLDLKTLSVIKTLEAGKDPLKVSINTITHKASVANEKSDDITVIDLNTVNVEGTILVGKHPCALAYNECLNTLSIIGGEDKSWMQVIDMDTSHLKATYNFDNKLKDIGIHPYLNISTITGEGGLHIVKLPNPLPQLISISPEKALRGEKSFSLNLSGIGLLAISEVYLNGSRVDATFPSCGSLSVNIQAGYLTSTEEVELKVINPSPEGGISNVLYLKVENPIPTLSVLDPSEVMAGTGGLTLTVHGTGFFDDTTVYINNTTRVFTLIDQTRLQIALTASDLEVGGYLDITASNPLPGGGQSNSLRFTVLNPGPSLSSLNPSSIIAGSPDFTLILSGDNFVKTSVIHFNNQQVSSKYASKTQIEATIPSSAITTPNSYQLKVINPTPGGGETLPLVFTVKPSLEVKITSPLDGETINKAKIIVKGTIQSDTKDVGIRVNGIVAEITGNEWIGNNVPLTIGTNTIEAVAAEFNGNTNTKTITVITNDITQFVELTANVTSGITPLQAYFSVSTFDFTPVSYQMDFEGDGVIDYTGTTFDDITHTYTSEGIFYPRLTVTDDQGDIYSDTIAINVLSKTEMDTLLKGKWEKMKGALYNKDVVTGVNFFIDSSKEAYQQAFNALIDELPQIIFEMQDIEMIYLSDSIAKYRINRVHDVDGVLQTITYYIYFAKDANGIWKIDRF